MGQMAEAAQLVMLSAAKHLVAGLETFSPLAWKSVRHVERSETSRNE